jgi:hypothetical protein
VAVLLVVGTTLLLPAVAAAEGAPWVGTYKGVGVGRDGKGKTARSGVTVWVEDLGGSTRFTFRFDKLPAVFDLTAPNAGGQKGAMLVRFSVNKAGVQGTGMIVLYPRDGNYMMAAKGAGKAMGKKGTGRLGAVRTSTGVELPSTVDQFRDLFSTLLGGKVSSSVGRPGSQSGGVATIEPLAGPLRLVSDDAGAVYASVEMADEAPVEQAEIDAVVDKAPEVVFVKAVTVEPASVVDLAAAKPPATTQTTLTVMVALLVLTGAAAVVGVGPRARRGAVAAGPGGQRGHGEGS